MKKFSRFTALAVALGCMAQGYADVQSSRAPAKKEVCAEHQFHHTQGGDWFTRVRALYILPDDSSGSVSSIASSGVSVHPSWTGEFDFGYMFTKHLGSELILATSRHTLHGKGSLSGVKIGSTMVLPPTLTLQWRFLPASVAQPYIGAGVNYSLFYLTDCSLPKTHLKLKHSWGPAVQAGMDIFFYKDWFVNLDVKYIWMKTHAHLHGGVNGHVHVDVNPWVMGFGFGRKW